MGRTRQTAKLPFANKPIEYYRPTDAQGAAVVLATKSNDSKAIFRFFQVIEALTVKSEDWDWMELQMINGTVEVQDFANLIEAIFDYSWPEPDGE